MERVIGPWELRRRKIAPALLAGLGLTFFGIFGFVNASFSQLPLSTGAPYVGQKAPSFTLPDQHGKLVSLADLLKPATGEESGGLVLIFYRGYWWPYCVSELRSFQNQLSEFGKRRIRVVGVSVDTVEVSRMLGEKAGLSFPLLSDPQEKAIRHYDLLHIRGGPRKVDIARPAEFLIDPTGTVRWVNLTDDVRVRARAEQVLRLVDHLGLGPRP
jgi:peroxiredoxin